MSNQEPFYLVRDRMLVKVKLRTEKHGDEDVNAYDVMLQGAFANAVLLKLDPELRPALYTQEQSDMLDGQTFNTLRFPELGRFDWTLSMGRMTLVIHDEDDEAESLTLTNREADNFHFNLLPGGTVNLGLRVKIGEIEDEDVLLKLLRTSHRKLLVSIHQAAIEEAADNFEKAEAMPMQTKAEKKAANLAEAQRQLEEAAGQRVA